MLTYGKSKEKMDIGLKRDVRKQQKNIKKELISRKGIEQHIVQRSKMDGWMRFVRI